MADSINVTATILLKALTMDDIMKIVDIEVKKVITRIEELGYDIKLSKKARSFLMIEGYDQDKGARELKRAIQKFVEDPISELILNGIEKGSIINGEYNKIKDTILYKSSLSLK